MKDKTPVEIASVQILEVGVKGKEEGLLKPIHILEGPFYDGDTFEYTTFSDSLNPKELLGDQGVPEAFTVALVNPRDNAVDKERASSFSTFWWYDLANCDAEPISKGDAIGLIEVVEYTSAIPAFCPAVGLTEFELDAHPVTEV